MTTNSPTISNPPNILRVDVSPRLEGSISRQLTDKVIEQFTGAKVTTRDLAQTELLHVTQEWISASFTPADDRTDAQKKILAPSDLLVSELETNDIFVIGLPVYNFSVPANLKAWIDLVARIGKTFKYTETGPEGLLIGKKAIIIMASGGTRSGTDIDFASPYLKHFMGFLGVTNVEIVAADGLMADPTRLEAANDAISALNKVS